MRDNSWRIRLIMTIFFPLVYLVVVLESIWEGLKMIRKTHASICKDMKNIYREIWRQDEDEHAHPDTFGI